MEKKYRDLYTLICHILNLFKSVLAVEIYYTAETTARHHSKYHFWGAGDFKVDKSGNKLNFFTHHIISMCEKVINRKI